MFLPQRRGASRTTWRSRTTLAGRVDAEEITIARNLGIALKNLATAAQVLQAARNQGIGTTLSL